MPPRVPICFGVSSDFSLCPYMAIESSMLLLSHSKARGRLLNKRAPCTGEWPNRHVRERQVQLLQGAWLATGRGRSAPNEAKARSCGDWHGGSSVLNQSLNAPTHSVPLCYITPSSNNPRLIAKACSTSYRRPQQPCVRLVPTPQNNISKDHHHPPPPPPLSLLLLPPHLVFSFFLLLLLLALLFSSHDNKKHRI